MTVGEYLEKIATEDQKGTHDALCFLLKPQGYWREVVGTSGIRIGTGTRSVVIYADGTVDIGS